MNRPKPWRTGVGVFVGLMVGGVAWWTAFEPAFGLMQKPQLLLLPAALGILVVNLRNRLKKAGPYDPEIVAMNRRGRL